MPQSNLSLYFSSNLITVMEEVLGYDWNVFLSDIGGSLGFLLGLSVIGALGLVEQIILVVFGRKMSKTGKEEVGEDVKNNSDEKNVPVEKIENLEATKIKLKLDDNEESVMVKNSLNVNDYKQNNIDKSQIITEKY